MKKIKDFIASPYFVTLLFILKMALYYALIKVNNLELLMIVVSMMIWGTIFICFGRSGIRQKNGLFLVIYFLFSLLMFADAMYFNYYNQTVSIRQLWQAKSVAAVPKSFVATLIPSSFLLFFDIPFAYFCFKKYASGEMIRKLLPWKRFRPVVFGLAAVVLTLIVNPFNLSAVAKVNKMEFFTSHVNDIYDTISDNLNIDTMDENEIMKVLDTAAVNRQQAKNSGEVPRYYGIGKDKNLLVIQLESVQNFVIGAEYNGQEITPNLNQLMKQDTLYFDHYFTNTGKGNTADAEFTSMNSLYPLIDGEVYRLYQDNTFNGLPWLMRENGYDTFAIHGYKGEFWNREAAYPNQGFQEFYSMEDLEQDDIIGMGISDKSMMRQLVSILKKQRKPVFTFAITLTNHHPYVLEEELRSLELLTEDQNTKFGDYLETVRYTDEAIGVLIDELKQAGLYEDTVIALYGDHHGLNCGMEDVQEQMTQYIGRVYDYDEMLRIPLIIHVPGSSSGETISITGGQIDFLPTIANIMGVDLESEFILGQDLANAKEGFVAFTTYLLKGSFANNDIAFEISREGIFEGSRAWYIDTNQQVDIEPYKGGYEKALLYKQTSKEILEQDMLTKYVNHKQ